MQRELWSAQQISSYEAWPEIAALPYTKRKKASISAIYAIECLGSGKIYVGRSCQAYARLHNHIQCLRNKSHACVPFQADVNRYGLISLQACFLEVFYFDAQRHRHDEELEWMKRLGVINSEKGYNWPTKRPTEFW